MNLNLFQGNKIDYLSTICSISLLFYKNTNHCLLLRYMVRLETINDNDKIIVVLFEEAAQILIGCPVSEYIASINGVCISIFL